MMWLPGSFIIHIRDLELEYDPHSLLKVNHTPKTVHTERFIKIRPHKLFGYPDNTNTEKYKHERHHNALSGGNNPHCKLHLADEKKLGKAIFYFS